MAATLTLRALCFASHNTQFRCVGEREDTYILQAVLDGSLDVQPIHPAEFGGDEDVVPRESAFEDRLSSFGLVPVRLGGIYEAELSMSRDKFGFG